MDKLLIVIGALLLFAAVRLFGIIGLIIAVGIMALLYSRGNNG